jgi:hypothetical protein
MNSRLGPRTESPLRSPKAGWGRMRPTWGRVSGPCERAGPRRDSASTRAWTSSSEIGPPFVTVREPVMPCRVDVDTARRCLWRGGTVICEGCSARYPPGIMCPSSKTKIQVWGTCRRSPATAATAGAPRVAAACARTRKTVWIACGRPSSRISNSAGPRSVTTGGASPGWARSRRGGPDPRRPGLLRCPAAGRTHARGRSAPAG